MVSTRRSGFTALILVVRQRDRVVEELVSLGEHVSTESLGSVGHFVVGMDYAAQVHDVDVVEERHGLSCLVFVEDADCGCAFEVTLDTVVD